MTTPETGEEYEAAQAAEYGRYRANRHILVDGVSAFAKGDAVPVGHVTRGLVPDAHVDDLTGKPKTSVPTTEKG